MTEVCLSAFVNITQFRSTDNYSSLSSLNYPFSIHQQITQRGDTFWRGVHFYRSHHTHYLRGRVRLNWGLTKLVVQNKTRETVDQPDRTMYSVLGNHQEWLSDWFRCLFVSLNYKPLMRLDGCVHFIAFCSPSRQQKYEWILLIYNEDLSYNDLIDYKWF